jgi:two-component system nitrogen regulation sensor histidine kinase NtrY
VAAVGKVPHKEVQITTNFDIDLKILRISVIDSGEGIPKTQRSRVFEPYFSTKEGGTGLGLSIVKRIVEDHNGFIRAVGNGNGTGSGNAQGTSMVIELPIP